MVFSWYFLGKIVVTSGSFRSTFGYLKVPDQTVGGGKNENKFTVRILTGLRVKALEKKSLDRVVCATSSRVRRSSRDRYPWVSLRFATKAVRLFLGIVLVRISKNTKGLFGCECPAVIGIPVYSRHCQNCPSPACFFPVPAHFLPILVNPDLKPCGFLGITVDDTDIYKSSSSE